MSDQFDDLEYGCRHHEMFALALREILRAAAPSLMEAIVAHTPQPEIIAAEKSIVDTARRLADRCYPEESQ
ncbi:MAG TPA: hypothetical protein VD835_11755 [Pyrinomonadaceae bacterium]|nr:hypothetical protein [Pyrinomonadaceae bacterium]